MPVPCNLNFNFMLCIFLSVIDVSNTNKWLLIQQVNLIVLYLMCACFDIPGQTLTGAGGEGFLVLLTKEPNMADKVKTVIQENRVLVLCIICTLYSRFDLFVFSYTEPSLIFM